MGPNRFTTTKSLTKNQPPECAKCRKRVPDVQYDENNKPLCADCAPPSLKGVAGRALE
jgi:hypothetical protein